MLYIKRKTNSPFQLATDFSIKNTIEGIKHDAERHILTREQDIYDQTIHNRKKMGIQDDTNPYYNSKGEPTNPYHYRLIIRDGYTGEKTKVAGKVKRDTVLNV